MRRLGSVVVVVAAVAAAGLVVVVYPAGAEPPPGRGWRKTSTSGATTAPTAPPTTAGSTTTTGATTTGGPVGTCTGVQVPAGADLAAASAGAAAGATLCLAAGTYRPAGPVTPKNGQRFVGQAGTVLDGGGTVTTAFAGFGGSPADVVIQGIRFTGFAGGGASGLVAAVKTSDRWQVLDNAFVENRIGVAGYGSGVRIERNYIHDNWQYGVIGNPLVLADNVISFNNNRRFGTGDAGGTKFVRVPPEGMQILRNYVHDNYGPGLWTDWQNSNLLFEGNTVERNVVAGIFQEVGGQAIIRNNRLVHNGLVTGGLFYQADIVVATSHDVEVYGNEVHTNANGIAVTDTDRCAGCVSERVSVHDNTVFVEPGGKIAAGLAGRPAAYTAGNTFTGNRYYVPDTAGQWWQWQPGPVGWPAWQAAEQDTTGTVS